MGVPQQLDGFWLIENPKNIEKLGWMIWKPPLMNTMNEPFRWIDSIYSRWGPPVLSWFMNPTKFTIALSSLAALLRLGAHLVSPGFTMKGGILTLFPKWSGTMIYKNPLRQATGGQLQVGNSPTSSGTAPVLVVPCGSLESGHQIAESVHTSAQSKSLWGGSQHWLGIIIPGMVLKKKHLLEINNHFGWKGKSVTS